MPGPGFFRLGRSLGRDTKDREALWIGELEGVRAMAACREGEPMTCRRAGRMDCRERRRESRCAGESAARSQVHWQRSAGMHPSKPGARLIDEARWGTPGEGRGRDRLEDAQDALAAQTDRRGLSPVRTVQATRRRSSATTRRRSGALGSSGKSSRHSMIAIPSTMADSTAGSRCGRAAASSRRSSR